MKIESTHEPRTIGMERTIRARESKGDALETKLFTFSGAERDEIRKKVGDLMERENLDGVLLGDPDNFTYATGADLPYAEQYLHKSVFCFFSRDGKTSVVFCEPDWVDVIRDQGWEGEILSYKFTKSGDFTDLNEKILGLLNLTLPGSARIGVDDDIWAESLYRLIHAIDTYQWVPVGSKFGEMRMVKTRAEIRLLEEACRHSDRAFVSALNHAEGNVHDALSYDLWEFAERIRVHVGEFGGSGTGNVTCMQGEDLGMLYKKPEGVFQTGNVVRAEISNHHRGYWSSGCRTLFIGQPGEGIIETYEAYKALKNEAASLLRQGMVCNEIYKQIVNLAEDEGIQLLKGSGFGHGIGASEREAPFISPDDATVLQEGMVIVLAIYMQTRSGELICSKDTYQITSDLPILLNWYRSWDRLYTLVGNSARHG